MKYLYTILIVLASNIVLAQNYNNILNYSFNSLPLHGVKIKTNLPFTPASYMPTITITGYNYGASEPINLSIIYYIYSGGNDFSDPSNYYFLYPAMSSAGAYTPRVYLSAENGKVVIFIDDKSYYQRFTVSAFAQGLSEISSWFEGWTAVDEPLTGVKTIEIPYKNRFKGDVNFAGNGIWNGNGYVGIGTNQPVEKLSVEGNISSSASSNEGGALILVNPVKKNVDNLAYRWALYNMTGSYGNSLQFWSYNYDTSVMGPKFVIGDNGNVGIGTTTPLAKLDVNGNINMPDGYNLTWGGDYGPDVPAIASSINAGINFYPSGSTLGSTMHINRNGNLVVGKITQSNSSYKLDVNGKARVNEIVVNTDGADFVFENDYRLRPLKEVEAFVRQEKHLPEMPTAKQMSESGVGLGELNTKLLQKVEELTLYLIERDKKINRLIKRVELLEQQKPKPRKQKANY
ncbi:hypothetical protein [Pedobacter miscanthi]|uniref:hypothetical protein n=1 Tax=Pedobacter miscanthi TaxID=2259170 RepID=UPI00293076BA|nr:hypothetical protein [Pedobacter miscanthi]